MINTVKTFSNYMREVMKGTTRTYYVYCVILLVISVIGLSNSLRFLAVGHGLSGMSDVVPWGIYISALAFFIGCSAGATIVGLLIHAFGREEYHPIGTRAILLALLSIFAATQCVMMDVGNPFRAMKIPFILRNPTSMFFISSTSYMGFMALLSAELYYTVKLTLGKTSKRAKKMAKWLGIIAVPYALVVVHSFTGTIFGVVIAREMWNTPLLPVHFVTSALASGFALVIVVVIITSKINKKELLSIKTYHHMGMLLAFFLIVTLFLDFFDYLIIMYNETVEGMETWSLLTGRYAPLFVLNIGGMTIAALLLMFKKGKSVTGLLTASFLTMAAILAYRINLLSVGQVVPLYPELGELEYIPTLTEIAPLIGLVALLMLLYAVLTKVLPMEERVYITRE
jgi:molybdopterin-containing oxidoreductase family membrane subunit